MNQGSAIAIVADNASAGPILEFWEEVGRLEHRPSMVEQGYPPHITLGLYPESPPENVLAVFEGVFAGFRPISLRFSSIRSFSGDKQILWAAPEPSPALSDLFRRLSTRIASSRSHAHYRPDTWIAHCTLGACIRADRRECAEALTGRNFPPFDVSFDRAELVSFPNLVTVRRFGGEDVRVHDAPMGRSHD